MIIQPWEQRFRGLRWKNMPGSTRDDQLINFFLFRRGLITVEEMKEEARPDTDEPDAERRLRNKYGFNRPKMIRQRGGISRVERPRAKRKPGPNGLPSHMQKSATMEEVLATHDEVQRVAEAAGMSLRGAARFIGIRPTAFARSEMLKASVKTMERMKQFLTAMEERNNQQKEAA
jgi:hypothetical protein